jgi:hypothetical protein
MLKSILDIDPQQTRTIVFTSSDDKENWIMSTRIDNDVDQLVLILEKQEELMKSLYHKNSKDLEKYRLLLIVNLLQSCHHHYTIHGGIVYNNEDIHYE